MIAGQILLGFSQGYAQRKVLARIMATTPGATTIFSLDLQRLASEGIRVLALDFDGVLAHHGADTPQPEAIAWLRAAAELFGEERLFILSNKPTAVRKAWFAGHFPSLRLIGGVRKKPYPDGLITIATKAQVPLSSVLMVDDRLLTGCLAALNAGARPCWINRPTVSFAARPLAELVFMLLRKVEQQFIALTGGRQV